MTRCPVCRRVPHRHDRCPVCRAVRADLEVLRRAVEALRSDADAAVLAAAERLADAETAVARRDPHAHEASIRATRELCAAVRARRAP